MVIGAPIGGAPIAGAFGRGFQGGAFQTSDPSKLHALTLQRLDDLEDAMAKLGLLPPELGHNQPGAGEVLTVEDRKVIVLAMTTLKATPAVPAARPDEAIKATEQLHGMAKKVGAYFGNKADVYLTELVKSAGAKTGTVIAVATAAVLLWLLGYVVDAAQSWLHALPPY